MTSPKIRPASVTKRQASQRLHAAIDAAGGTTPCRDRAEFTADVQHPLESADLAHVCRTQCPVLAECKALAVLLPRSAKAGAVLAGERYDLTGCVVDLDVDLDAELLDDVDDELVELVELVDVVDVVDGGADEGLESAA